MSQIRPISDAPGYFVSDDGRVFTAKSGARREMTQSPQHGYRRVTLRIDGKTVYRYVHVIVAMAFLGPCPSDDHEVLHADGSRDNNTVGNLSWGTRSENMLDAVRHGRNPQHLYPEKTARGTKVYGAKLNEDAVRQIRARSANGAAAATLAAEFNVSADAIRRVLRRDDWKHVV